VQLLLLTKTCRCTLSSKELQMQMLKCEKLRKKKKCNSKVSALVLFPFSTIDLHMFQCCSIISVTCSLINS
jgi:disulfide bond formation protein DsbB